MRNPSFVILTVLLFYYLLEQLGAASVPPTWLPNTYFQCKSAVIKANLSTTFNSSNPITTPPILFTKTYTVVPQLAYSIKNYRGKDYLMTQNFALQRRNLTNTYFIIYVMIDGLTNIRILNIQYLAVDKSFPYHCNVFSDIPVNYSSSALTNISTSSAGRRFYTNTINYTTFATAFNYTFKKFGTNLSKNFVALYLCAIFNNGAGATGTTKVNFTVLTSVVDVQRFQITVTAQTGYIISLLRFSIVAMDIANIQSSGLFTIQFNYTVFNASIDNYIAIPKQFAPATFIGLLDYTAKNNSFALQFNWELDLPNNRVIINASVPYTGTSAKGGLQSYRIVVFYVKTWDCNSSYPYFNLNTNLCDDYCAKYFYPNVTAEQCQPCIFACYQCANGATLPCTNCNVADNRQLINGSCVCKVGFYQNMTANATNCIACSVNTSNCATCSISGTNNTFTCLTCVTGWALNGTTCISCSVPNCITSIVLAGACKCSLCASGFTVNSNLTCSLCNSTLGANCLQCSNTTTCTLCNASATFFLNTTSGQCSTCNLIGCLTCTDLDTCFLCNQTGNYFLNSSGVCQACALNQCISCFNLTSCATCNQSNNYFLNITTGLCQFCLITGCSTCLTINQCLYCNNISDYFFNDSNICQKCSLKGCIDCINLTTCFDCNLSAGYYMNVNTQLCQKCPILYCQDCYNISACSVCVTGYYVNSTFECQPCSTSLTQCTACNVSNECLVCNTTNDYFLDIVNKTCVPCSLTQCLDCFSQSQCIACNTTKDYFLNGSICQQCNLNQCTDCSNLSTCITCNASNNYFINLAYGLCQFCNQSGCITCANLTTCSYCNTSDNYYLNLSSNTCFQCDTVQNLFINSTSQCQKCSLVGCVTCTNLITCFLCDQFNNYFLDPNTSQCVKCNLTQCTDCLNLTQCTTCNTTADYFLNGSNICQPCILTQCTDCNSLSNCSACNNSNNYFLNASDVCQQCSIIQCTICTNLTACNTCNASNNYFVNSTTLQCDLCLLVGCSTCLNLDACSVCNFTALYFKNTSNLCYYCDPLLNMFVNGTACQTCTLTQCTTCANLTACSVCNALANYVLRLTDGLCYPCTLEGCILCDNQTACLLCDTNNNFALVANSTCQHCSISCTCDGYVPSRYIAADGLQYCSTLCGDGLTRNFQECDDNNIIDGDGCSSTCTIQTGWSCQSNEYYTCCTIQGSMIVLDINKITKIPGANSMSIQLQIKPYLPVLTANTLKNHAMFSVIGVPLFNQRVQAIGGQKMIVTYDFNETIHGRKGFIQMGLTFGQAADPSCLITANKQIQIMAQASNNLPFMFYTQKDLQKRKQVQSSVTAAQIITYILFFISMIPCKIIGLELIGVLQLAYFSLAQQQNINVLLEPFMKMKQINGLNFDVANQNQNMPDQVQALGIRALFLNNCNVMLLLVIAETIVALVLFILSHILKQFSKKLSSVSKYLIKEGLLTLMMFNAFNIAFGVGIHFQYADKNNQNYVLSSLAAILASGLLFGTCLLLMLAQAKQFGQFKDKLKPNLLCQLYFVFSLAYRYALGYYIAVKNEYLLSSLVIIGFSFIFIMYNLVNLPFKSAYHNYRANICHFAQLVILFVTNYYDSLLQNEPLSQKAYQFNAAQLQLFAIYASIVVSAACLAVDGYKFIKAKFGTSSQPSSPIRSIKQSLPDAQINNTMQDLNLSNGNYDNYFIQNQNELPIMPKQK